jgi:hypothetical protein
MDERSYDREEDPVFHERPHLLSTKGYRGYSVKKTEQHWEGVKVTAANKSGNTISASGDTEKEALKKLVDQIDMILDQ